jgi:predicted nucleotidyltransferase component of viral defense system
MEKYSKKQMQKVGVRDQQIEKDYILSWILFGISKHEYLSKTIVFKGGTVLKKVYFEDYRFSEDLDFTLLNSEILTSKFSLGLKKYLNSCKMKPIFPLKLLTIMSMRMAA